MVKTTEQRNQKMPIKLPEDATKRFSKSCQNLDFVRGCLHEGGGPQIGEVTRLGWVKK